MISVVVPVYNTRTDYIQQCIDSVLCCSNVEIIIINDGSTETEVIELCERYAMLYDNIQLINQMNSGPSVSRNKGIANARGEYIAFLDSDDWWSNGVFEKIYRVLEKQHPDVLMFQAEKVEFATGNRMAIGKIPTKIQQWKSGKDALKAFLSEDPYYEWYAWKYIFSRKLFVHTNMQFEKGLYYEDVDLIPRLLHNSGMTVRMPDVLLNYRFHNPTSILNTPNTKKSNDKLIVVNRMIDYCEVIEDRKLKKQLLQNVSMLMLSAYGDYLNGVPVDIDMLERAFALIKYSRKRFGRISRVCCGLFGFQCGSKLLQKLLKKINREAGVK